MKKFIFKENGFINDTTVLGADGKIKKSYHIWCSIIKRCYSEKCKEFKYYGAKGVTICDEWKIFSVFEKWYNENYIEGYQIDKDLKSSDKKEYSPENCLFVTRYTNLKEAHSRRDYSNMIGKKNKQFGMKGEKSTRHKPIEYYETKFTQKSSMKNICKRNGWDFDSLEVIETKVINGYKMSKYKGTAAATRATKA